MSFSAEAFKRQFPLFAQGENARLVYLDNAATTQKPLSVINAVRDYYMHSSANTHRSSHRLARKATEMVERVRGQAAEFVNAASPNEMVFCRGATEALNLLAHCLCSGLAPGDEIVISTAEHHANIVPWQMAAERYQLTLRYVPDTAGVPRFDQLNTVLNERTRVVSITGGANAIGLRPDLAQVRRQVQHTRSVWIVDGAQLAAHEVVDVQKIGCDFFVCSAHKFYGPTGIGLLYGREALLEAMPPWLGGGEMITEVGLQTSRYAGLPHKFEAGTSPLAAIAGLGAVLAFLARQDREAMAAHEQKLVHWLHRELEVSPDFHLVSQARNNLGIASFVPVQGSAADLMHWLDERDIAVRVGHHCAQLLGRAGSNPVTVRASVAAYNTDSDIRALLQALGAYCDFHRPTAEQLQRESGSGQRDDLTRLSLAHLVSQRNWQSCYRELLLWGKVIHHKPEVRRQENLVQGCESQAWLVHRQEGGRHFFELDSDSRVVKGLGALLLSQIDGRTAGEISALDLPRLFEELGLGRHLSQSRSNGFYALMRRALQQVEASLAQK
ncbi:aminotransferase class V-fold PLP-dependent enzyme [Microbulbifer sp. 2205BS26-8]|uniref:aminotransferase class V-fold PLP-dependent enzyme n=1 Tax=Microbulbifer sp. 2205BS26-8 TaxID=3064386 RepID=UPI00273F16C3|nr:aminotransferase class V-fold PLP-dependent enzyme [Microbulbifer sp. 2205BS26-8]MDP5208349.1 aminotransferase class V-fold PLP-dependent enzyme [Microbulbifer sp. 2205BS26-8]